MAFRNVIVENPASLSVRNDQLVNRTDAEHTLAIEILLGRLVEADEPFQAEQLTIF